MKKRDAWQKKEAKAAKKAAKKEGAPEDWEKHMGEMPEELLEPEEVAKRKFLTGVAMFEGLAENGSFIAATARRLEEKKYKRREMIIEKGAEGAEMYFVVKGEAEVLLEENEPGIFVLAPGQFFGEQALVSNQPRNAFVRAKSRMTLWALTKEDLDGVFASFPEMEAVIKQADDGRRAERLAFIEKRQVRLLCWRAKRAVEEFGGG